MSLWTWISMLLLFKKKTCFTSNVSDQKIISDVFPAGYSFHHGGRIHKTWGISFVILWSLKSICSFRISLFKIINWSLYFKHHVEERIHRNGHMLDLVISRDYDNLLKGVSIFLRCLAIFLLSLIFLCRNILLQLKVFYTGNISRLTRMFPMLIWRSLLCYWINQMVLHQVVSSRGSVLSDSIQMRPIV